MRRAIDQAVQGGSGAPLTNEQKKRVILRARKGFCEQGHTWEKRAFDAWRYRESVLCVEKESLRACTQEDYPHLMGHFSRLAGDEKGADYWFGRTLGDGRRRARAKLEREMKGAEDVIQEPRAYVAAIARCKFHTTDLRELSEKQVWGMVFDLRRGAQKRRKALKTSEVPF